MGNRVDFSFAIGMIRRNAALLAFPVLSAAVVALVSLVLLAPVGLQVATQVADGVEDPTISPVAIVLLVVAFLVNACVVAFFSGALTSEALVVVRGGRASVGHGLSVAFGRMLPLFAWGLVTATVGLILQAIRERAGAAGALLSIIGGLAWGIATLFVLPVVIVEGHYPVAAVKRSIAILRSLFGPDAALGGLRRAWGYGVGYLVVFFGGALLGIALVALGAVTVGNGSTVLGVPAIVAGVIVLGVVAIVSTALGAMVSAVLYVYATERTTPDGVDGTLLERGLAAR
jgi:hypothetical protein